jgi:molybdopterin converting factor subunit 1
MKLRVKLFAAAKQRAGTDAVEVELPQPATVAGLRSALAEQHPNLASLLPHARLAINSDYASDQTIISAAAEIAIIPPVSGG